MRPIVLLSLGLSLLYSPCADARGAEAAVRLTSSGLAFLSRTIPSLVPSSLQVATIGTDLYGCSGTPARVDQENTTAQVQLSDVILSTAGIDRLRVSFALSATAQGEAHFSKPYFCSGDERCADTLRLDQARGVIELGAEVTELGKLRVQVFAADLTIDPAQLDVSFSGCNLGGLLTEAVSLAEGLALQALRSAVADLATQQIAPMVEGLLGGILLVDGQLGPLTAASAVKGVDLGQGGIGVLAQVSFDASAPVGTCLEGGLDPQSPPGLLPDLGAIARSHLALAIHTDVVANAVGQLFATGLRCGGHEAELEPSGRMGSFPEGTQFRVRTEVGLAPEISPVPGETATLAMKLPSVAITVRAIAPDGSTTELSAETRAGAQLSLELDLDDNALKLGLGEVRVEHMKVTDELGATASGFDVRKVRAALERRVIPALLADLDGFLVLPRAFSLPAGLHLILRGLRTTSTALVVDAELFRAPLTDDTSPQTVLAALPPGPLRPEEARLIFSGQDAEIPAELLRYLVRVNGLEAQRSYRASFLVGRPGVTASYDLEVSAIDLQGNVDPTPATATVLVDGVAPRVELAREIDPRPGTPLEVVFNASDDLTEAAELGGRVEVVRLSSQGDEEPVATYDLPRGATSLTLQPLPEGSAYRVSVVVLDQAGNEGLASASFRVGRAGGGCGIVGAGRPGAAAPLGLVAIALVLLCRRRVMREAALRR